MRIKRFAVLIAAGILLLIAAVAFEVHFVSTDKKSGDSAERIVRELKEITAENGEDTDTPENPEENTEDFISCDSGEYYGILSIPSIAVELPVSYDYSYDRMSESLCRYSGSLDEGNLIICGHNYKSFLQNLGKVNEGDSAIFTDSKGENHEYVVNEIQLIGGYQLRKLTDGGTDWDLSVFTCNYSGYSRWVLRCKTVE